MEAVESALAQTYSPLSVFVVDDGSTDPDTLSALLLLETTPRVIVARQENAGSSAARNSGVRMATDADYVLCLDDDDLIGSTYVEKAVRLLEEDKSLGVVYCQARKFGEVEAPWELPRFSPERMSLGNIVFAAALFRRVDWVTLGGYSEALTHHEDYDFWIRMIALGRDFYQIPEELFFYRVGHPSLIRPNGVEKSNELDASLSVVIELNRDFFSRHLVLVHQERRRLERELLEWKMAYASVDSWLRPTVRMAKAFYRAARRCYVGARIISSGAQSQPTSIFGRK